MNKAQTILKAYGFKVTLQRVIIYQALSGNSDHPSSESVFRRIRCKYPNISFDTINRTMVSFSNAGIIRAIKSFGRSKRYDTNIGGHHHMHCFKCDKVVDFQSTAYDKIPLPGRNAGSFKVGSVRVVVEGLCNQCADKSVK